MGAKPQETIKGYLFSKLVSVGTKSEGRLYFVQQFGGVAGIQESLPEIQIEKKTPVFEDDANLLKFLDAKVIVVGSKKGDSFAYTLINECNDGSEECKTSWKRN